MAGSKTKTALGESRSNKCLVKPSFHIIAMIAAQGSQQSLRSLRAYGNIHSAIFAIVATVIAEIEKFLSLRSLRSLWSRCFYMETTFAILATETIPEYSILFQFKTFCSPIEIFSIVKPYFLRHSVKSSKFLSFLEDTSHPKSVFFLFLPISLPSSLQNSKNKKVARLKSTSLICGCHHSNVCAKFELGLFIGPITLLFLAIAVIIWKPSSFNDRNDLKTTIAAIVLEPGFTWHDGLP